MKLKKAKNCQTALYKNPLFFFAFLFFFAPSSQAAEVILAGDSTVATYNSGDKQGWGAKLSIFTKNLKVINYAKGGRTTRSFRAEGLWSKALREKSDFAFIQFGHNDSHQDSDRYVSVKDFKNYLRDYIEEARKQNTTPYLVTPPHRCRFSGSTPTRELKPYVDAMKEVAKEMGASVLDLDAQTYTFLKSQGSSACKKYFVKNDATHFNSLGAEKMASFVVIEAKKIPRLAPYFK